MTTITTMMTMVMATAIRNGHKGFCILFPNLFLDSFLFLEA